MGGLGATELLVLVAVGVGLVASVVGYALAIWALVDVVSSSDEAFERAGQNRTLWLILNIVGLVSCVVVPIVYLAVIRPKVRRATPSL